MPKPRDATSFYLHEVFLSLEGTNLLTFFVQQLEQVQVHVRCGSMCCSAASRVEQFQVGPAKDACFAINDISFKVWVEWKYIQLSGDGAKNRDNARHCKSRGAVCSIVRRRRTGTGGTEPGCSRALVPVQHGRRRKDAQGCKKEKLKHNILQLFRMFFNFLLQASTTFERRSI